MAIMSPETMKKFFELYGSEISKLKTFKSFGPDDFGALKRRRPADLFPSPLVFIAKPFVVKEADIQPGGLTFLGVDPAAPPPPPISPEAQKLHRAIARHHVVPGLTAHQPFWIAPEEE